jgi:peptidoglycan/xylan/chitin deacetylase (PgdA/CDA1 family)
MQAAPSFFLHIDLDGLWTLPACYGYPEGREFTDDPVFTVAAERLLALLKETGLQATVFIIGRDLELPAKAEQVRRFAEAGHRLANHSYTHDLALEIRAPETILAEMTRTQAALTQLAGRAPLGFRCPGYGAGPKVLQACAQAGFKYDGSAFPSPSCGLLLRFAMGSLRGRVRAGLRDWAKLRQPEVAPLDGVYGGAEAKRCGLAPFRVNTPAGALWRLPVAVTPRLHLPLQASLSINLGARRVVGACRALARRGLPITWLLHGLDLLGADDLAGRLPPVLARSRAFNIPLAQRLQFIRTVLAEVPRFTQPQLAEEWVEAQGA